MSRTATADRRVDVVHDLPPVRGDEVRDLRRVDARSATNRHEPVEAPFHGEVRRLLKRLRRRLHAGPIVELDLDPFGLDQLLDAGRYTDLDNPRVRDEHHPVHAHPLDLPADLLRGPGSILERRGLHREDGLVARAAVPLPAHMPPVPSGVARSRITQRAGNIPTSRTRGNRPRAFWTRPRKPVAAS